ncbi:Prophage endopeptidase tail [Streptococcus henryi]|uniref:Prophage endopeptidase tail n=1 Tax=Streptococcus henryi TaxID=439219 RepID=A0A1G6AJJ4_9STRE|nr:phage tail protein [Streptococcus henryi]QBX25313.1 tail assembly protein [Streptococcus phage Javan252]SDB08565.1 Prophage endopeptidase tail [Streptococcus henryi]
MQIVVHDNKMRKVTILNNRIQKSLSFSNDSWHRYLAQGVNTFDFVIPKFYNGKIHDDVDYITDDAHFSFRYRNRNYVFYVETLTQDDFSFTLSCNDRNLELTKEQANPFTSDKAQKFEWYLENMGLLALAGMKLGNNEIGNLTRTLSFENQETKLARLQSLCAEFDAEFEFVNELNKDGSFKQTLLNVYHEADDTHHSVGRLRNDVLLRYGKDVKGVQVVSDKSQLFNAGRFTGADGLTIKDLEKSVKDEDGREEFYTRKGNDMIYAPLSADKYPSKLTNGDNWTRKDFSTEYTNANDLLAYALKTIKQYAYPILTYTATIQSNFLSNYDDLELGDTVKIIDNNFKDGLLLQARVSEQVISFSNPNNNSLVFSNYVKLKNQISDALKARMARLAEEAQPYTIKFSSDNGMTFKNHKGETTVIATLQKGSRDIKANWKWSVNNELLSSTDSLTISASGFEKTLTVAVAAIVGGQVVTTDQITFTNVNDGAGIKKITPLYGSSEDGETTNNWSTNAKAATKSEPYVLGKFITELTDGTQIETNNFVAAVRSPEFDEVERFKQGIYKEIEEVDAQLAAQSEAHNQAVAEILAQATSVEDLASEAKRIGQQAIANAISVANQLSTARQALQSEIETAKTQAGDVAKDLLTQAEQLNAQATKQEELTKLTTETKKLVDGQITTISELSKTVAQNGKDITSVQSRTKTVEDTLSGTKITLEQVKVTSDTVKSNLAEYKVSNDGAVAGLRQSIKDANGNISDLKTLVGLVPGKISAAVEAVEAKIPTVFGGRNLAQKTSSDWSTPYTAFSGIANTCPQLYRVLTDGLSVGDTLKSRILLKYTNVVPASGQTAMIWLQGSGNVTSWNAGSYSGSPKKTISGSGEIVFEHEFKINADHLKNSYWNWQFRTDYIASGSLEWKLAKVESGDVFTAWSPAPEDAIEEISSVKSELKLTKEGLTGYFNKTDSNASSISTHTNQISALNNALSAKVSTTDYNKLTDRVSSAESAISVQAGEISKRLTSTQVESAITAKGYQTKAQVDSNITGRGYITSSALQPYATMTALENKVTETAGEYTRLISETKALIPSGEPNLVPNGRPEDGVTEMGNVDVVTHGFYYNSNQKLYRLTTSDTSEITQSFRYFPVERNTDYTLYFKGFNNSAVIHMDVWFLRRVKGSTNTWDNAQKLIDSRKLSISRAEEITVTFNTGGYDEGYIRFDNNGTTVKGTRADLYFGDVCVKKGKSNNGWSPAVADLTTVTAFNKVSETVDEYKRLISSGGSLSKAIQSAEKFEQSIASGGDIYQAIQTAKGLATTVSGANGLSTQVSQLAGSYAIKNLTSSGTVLNQLNLNKDGSVKIDGSLVRITGKTVIDNAVIKSAMIADGQIGTAQIGTIDGATANIININAKNISADGLSGNIIKGGTLRSTNNATNFDLVNGKLNFDTDTASVRRVTSGIPTQFVKFLKSSNGALTVIGSNRDGSESADNDSFAGFKIYSSSTTEVSEIISDQIYFLTGTNNRRGWQMSTITGADNKQISLFPTGDPTKSLIYASDYYIKRNGKNIALIDFITYVNACLKHLQNYTGRTDIWNDFAI